MERTSHIRLGLSLLTAALVTGLCLHLSHSASAQTGVGSGIATSLLPTLGHCDTMDGPVVVAAKKALSTGNVDLALVWVGPQDEPEIRRTFAETQEVGRLGPQAKRLADRHFFETLVRVHRAGEKAPYTGLKPAGTPVEPAVAQADAALAKGSVEPLVKELTRSVESGLRHRFETVLRAKSYQPNDLAAGRAFVKAYIEYVHYAEGIGAATESEAHGHYPEGREGQALSRQP